MSLIAAVLAVAALAAPHSTITHSPDRPIAGQTVVLRTNATCGTRTPCTFKWYNDSRYIGKGQTLRIVFPATTVRARVKVYDRRGVLKDQAYTSFTVKRKPVPQPPTETTPTEPPVTTPTETTPTEPPVTTPTETTPTEPPDPTCTSASPSDFASKFAAAGGGDILCLTAGDYGTFQGSNKPGRVTLRSGNDVSMIINFSGASNITVDGPVLKSINITGSTHDVTLSGSQVIGQTYIDATSFRNANVVLDQNTFDNINVCGNCFEGRITVRGSGSISDVPSGVSITNSHIGNLGESDGVQIIGQATGVKIGPGNEFSGIKQGSYSRHVDSIQLYGSSQTQIVGNYFHDDDTIIMAPDGGDREFVSHNVMIGSGYVSAVQFGHHNGTTFTHNTIKNLDVQSYVSGVDSSPNRNIILRDNLLINASLNAGGCQNCVLDHNTATDAPIFAGGASPTTYSGFKLVPTSPGHADASDGSDTGI